MPSRPGEARASGPRASDEREVILERIDLCSSDEVALSLVEFDRTIKSRHSVARAARETKDLSEIAVDFCAMIQGVTRLRESSGLHRNALCLFEPPVSGRALGTDRHPLKPSIEAIRR